MSSVKRRLTRRRAGFVVAAALLLCTPPLAFARLRGTLLPNRTRASLTSQSGQQQSELGAVQALLTRVRGTNAYTCQLAMVAIDRSNWYGGLEDVSSIQFVDDSIRVVIPHELASPAVVEPLWTALRDADPCVRRAAASLFGRARAPSARERLRAALDDSRPETRALAALALGLAEDQAAGAKLQSLLRDASLSVRATAAWALGELEYKAAINALAEILERDPSARVRRAAARALGQIAGH